VYKLKRRVTIKRFESTQNEIGGLVAVQTGAWNKWAEVQERTGNSVRNYAQDQWSYDTVVIMRYEKERPTRSNDVIYYENTPYKINSIQIKNEGAKWWEYIKVTKIDEDINSDAPMDTDTIKVLNYTATISQTDFEFPQLIGKTIFGAFKDGIQYVVITTGTAEGKQVLFDASAGALFWGIPFEPDEVLTILYY
jgi:SPP1 family predicted phage head-tail adaptor